MLGGAGLRHPSLRGPEKGLLKEILLIEGAGTKVLGRPHALPEAGGQVGEVPVAVSWEWLPGAPCGGFCCCEGRPACEFVGLHSSSDSVRSVWDAVASGLPNKKKTRTYVGRGTIKHQKCVYIYIYIYIYIFVFIYASSCLGGNRETKSIPSFPLPLLSLASPVFATIAARLAHRICETGGVLLIFEGRF